MSTLGKDLLSDPKELAEHSMLVDLGRNDIGKVSEFGSVELEKAFQVERYSHVMHIGSTVKGRIRKDLDALDAIASILPAGTLSGAPKIRAAQIIDELEDCRRGIYGGAMGYIQPDGQYGHVHRHPACLQEKREGLYPKRRRDCGGFGSGDGISGVPE